MKAYLACYNGLQLAMWVNILALLLYYNQKAAYLVPLIRTLCTSSHFLMSLEPVHSFLKIANTSPIPSLIQVSARNVFIWGYLELKADTEYAYALLLAWSLAEIIRYTYYFSGTIGTIPYLFTWLRYSSFIVLYVTGVFVEILVCYEAVNSFITY